MITAHHIVAGVACSKISHHRWNVAQAFRPNMLVNLFLCRKASMAIGPADNVRPSSVVPSRAVLAAVTASSLAKRTIASICGGTSGFGTGTKMSSMSP